MRKLWPVVAVVISNLAVIVPVFFGAPAGNPMLLWLLEAIAIGVISLLVIRRAAAAGRADSLPTLENVSPDKHLAGVFVVWTAMLGFVIHGFSRASGLQFTPNAFWFPLALVLLRVALDAIRARPSGDLGTEATAAALNWLLHYAVLSASIMFVIWIFKDVAQDTSPGDYPVLIVALFAAVKIAAELWIVRISAMRAAAARKQPSG